MILYTIMSDKTRDFEGCMSPNPAGTQISLVALGQKNQKQNEGTVVFSAKSIQNPTVTFKGKQNEISVVTIQLCLGCSLVLVFVSVLFFPQSLRWMAVQSFSPKHHF